MSIASSPVERAGLRDRAPNGRSPEQRLLIFNLRAYGFFSHPFFWDSTSLLTAAPRDIVFESLAYRLRPIAMTTTDDASIWATLKTLRELEAMPAEKIEHHESKYEAWLAMSNDDLREWWPDWELEQPLADNEVSVDFGAASPAEVLWERVYGQGPHSDFSRVLRVSIRDWTGTSQDGSARRSADLGKLLAMMRVVREVIVELHNDVLEIIDGRALGDLYLRRRV